MTKTIGKITCELIAPKQGVYPFNAIVHIVPKRFTTDKSGWPRLSPQLMTEGEIDGYVTALKQDLDAVGRQAKMALRRANERTLADVKERVAAGV